MTEEELVNTGIKWIEESLFSPHRPTELPPEHELIVEDVFTGLRGTWTVLFDTEWLPMAPDDDRCTVPRAHLRWVELDGDEFSRPYRFELHQIDAITLSVLQDLADDEVEAME